jgi:glutamate-1-semialdehyde 2,1-aminomutase
MWQLQPDVITLGKAAARGLPMGAYGFTAELGGQLDAARNIATGSTLFENPLSAAAAKAALTRILVPGAYAHATALGTELADGIGQAITSAGLPWTVIRLRPSLRSVVRAHAPHRSPSARAHRRPAHPPDTDLACQPGRMEGAARSGPTVPVPATPADVARYVEDYTELLAELH